MRNLFKKSWLFVALMATLTMVGCGGGGGSKNYVASQLDQEAQNVKTATAETVGAIVKNIEAIIPSTVSSLRASTNTSVSNTPKFDVSSTNNAVMTALEAPKLIRAVISAAGGNVKEGLFLDNCRWYTEVATFSNGIYEHTKYFWSEDDIKRYNAYNADWVKNNIEAHYKIEGCSGDFDEKTGTLKSFTIKPNAKITIDEYKSLHDDSCITHLVGNIDTDLTVKWEGNTELYRNPILVDSDGKEILIENDQQYYFCYRVNSKTISSTTFTFSRIKLNVTEYHHYNNKGGDRNYNEYNSKNLSVAISGINGNITMKKTSYKGESVYVHGNDSFVYGSENLIITDGFDDNFTFSNPKIVLIGSITDKAISNKPNPTELYNANATVNNVTVAFNNISYTKGNWNSFVVEDAEAHVDVGNFETDQAIMVGDTEVTFNKAKIDITGLKYDYRWEPSVEKNQYSDLPYWYQIPNPEYDRLLAEMYKKCFANTKVHVEAEDTKYSSKITADCDINGKTVSVNIANCKNYMFKTPNNMEIALNNAKINIAGFDYSYYTEPTSEKYIWIPVNNWWGGYYQRNEEYNKELKEIYSKCLGNAKVHFEAEETKNYVTVKADCDVKAKTASVNVVNNGNYIVKDETSNELLEFNFKTIDIKATNADIQKDCEGAVVEVTGVEKDGRKSERTYNVVNGKLVLITSRDKQLPTGMEDVDIKEDETIQDSESIASDFTDELEKELQNDTVYPNKTKDAGSILKVKDMGNKKIASFKKEKKNESDKEMTAKITAVNNIIATIAFYGDYMFIFYIDCSKEATREIKGGIFDIKFQNSNLKWNSPERFGFFTGKGNSIQLSLGGTPFTVPLN